MLPISQIPCPIDPINAYGPFVPCLFWLLKSSELGQPVLPHARRRRLVHSPQLLLSFSFLCGRPCSYVCTRPIVAKVVHALTRAPSRHIHSGSKGPLGFALAVVLAVEEPSSDSEGRETDDDDNKHDNPTPVSRHPRGALRQHVSGRSLQDVSHQGPGVGFTELLESC